MTIHGIDRSRVLAVATLAIALSSCADAGPVLDLLHHHGHSPSDHGGPRPDAAMGGAGHATADAESPTCPAPSDGGAGATAGDGAVDAETPTFSTCRLIIGAPATGICVPAAPFGWRVGSLFAAPTLDALPACSAADALTAVVLAGPPASACGSCTCGPPEGLACGAASASDLWFDPECVRPCTAACFQCGLSCVTTGVSCAFHSTFGHYLGLVPAALTGGSCQPSMPPSPPPLSLERAVRACLDTGPFIPDCAPGLACARTQGRVCLFHDGDSASCPRGPYRERMVFNAQTSDTRACTSCSCGGPAGVTCPTRIESYGPPPGACAGPLQSMLETDSTCLDLAPFGNGGALRFVAGEPAGGGACASGGSETGTVTQSEPFTACCIPEGFTVL